MRYGLSEEAIRRIIEVFSSYVEIEAAALYGSRAFDLSLYHQINNPDLIEHIKRVKKVFYKKGQTEI